MPSDRRFVAILFGIHLLAGALFLSPSYIRPDSVAVISWLRSLVIDFDFLFFDEWAGFRMLGDGFAYFKEVTPVGALANHWWIGTSILVAPFYLAARLVSTLLGGAMFPNDGFFGLYLATVGWAAVFFHALALLLAWAAMRRLADDRAGHAWLAPAALVFASLGTPAFWYAFRVPVGTHAAGMLTVGLLTFLCIRDSDLSSEDRDDWSGPLLTGLTFGLAIATRIQHVFLLPAVLLTLRGRSSRTREQLLLLTGAAVPVLIQGAAWVAAYGTPFGPVTAGANLEGVTWMPFRRISFLPVLFSSWRGLFVWSPVWIAAIAGMIVLLRDRESPLARRAGAVCLLMFAGELVANATLDRYWWGGMSFGPRRFVDLTVPVAIGLWAVLRRTRLTGAVAAGVATLWSCLLMLGAYAGTIDLARYLSWSDLIRGVESAGSAIAVATLQSPVTSAALAIQSLVAVAIIASLSVAAWRMWRGRPGSAARLAFQLLVGVLIIVAIAIAPTRTGAAKELDRFGLRTEAARSVGPLIDQRGLISDELAWLEATGRAAEAARTREEIARIDARLRELGLSP